MRLFFLPAACLRFYRLRRSNSEGRPSPYRSDSSARRWSPDGILVPHLRRSRVLELFPALTSGANFWHASGVYLKPASFEDGRVWHAGHAGAVFAALAFSRRIRKSKEPARTPARPAGRRYESRLGPACWAMASAGAVPRRQSGRRKLALMRPC
jgi:hypothetical protein